MFKSVGSGCSSPSKRTTLVHWGLLFGMLTLSMACQSGGAGQEVARTPNILFAISDDQSFSHTSHAGCSFIETPAFDRVAEAGTVFTNAFVAAPQCSPSRAAILTGKNIWQLEEAGTHSSYFPRKFAVFTDQLEAAGYDLGYTGKPWGPGNWQDAGWTRNPVGNEYNQHRLDSVPYSGINDKDYAGNFQSFHQQKDPSKPFFFWFGGHEPHRVFELDGWKRTNKNLASVQVPAFLPDDPVIRGDLLDYALEIEWFDAQLNKMLEFLDRAGELDNTIVIVTADNGMAFPAAKANLYEYGTHVPLAISGPAILSKRTIDAPVSLIDIAPTLLDLTGCAPLTDISGTSLLPLMTGESSSSGQQYVLTGRERHTHARADNLGYPARAIRNSQYLFIKNLASDR
ncbi:MAG: sulfatase, partial [Saprospiraceae bacterium]|nr:sulfatase [Saprospiraceae bacterium]